MIALGLGLRLLVLLAPPADLDPSGHAGWEEVHRGTTALELVQGPLLPAFEYQWNGWWGGSLVVPLLAMPSVLVLGPTLLALRLVTLLFAALAIGAVFVLLDRAAGRRAAWAGALLLALPAPGHLLFASQAWGTHAESQALALGLVLLFVRFHASGGGRRTRGAFLLGLAAGCAVFFALSLCATVAVLLIVERVTVPGRLPTRDALARAGGFLVGCAPRFWEMIYYGGLHPAGAGVPMGWRQPFPGGVATLGRLGVDLSSGTRFPGALGPAFGALYVVLLVGLALLVSWPRRVDPARTGLSLAGRQVRLTALWHLALIACVTVFTSFRIGERETIFGLRYAIIPFTWITLLAALAMGTVLAHGARARVAGGAVLTVCLLAVLGVLGTIRVDGAAKTWRRAGHSDPALGRFVMLRADGDEQFLGRAADRLLQREEAQRVAVFAAMGEFGREVERWTNGGGPRRQSLRERSRRNMEFLRGHVPEPYKVHFELARAPQGVTEAAPNRIEPPRTDPELRATSTPGSPGVQLGDPARGPSAGPQHR